MRKLPPNELRVAFAVPGDLAMPTGGYVFDRRIIQELRQLSWQVDVVDIGGDFPFPSMAQRAHALAMLSGVPAGCPVVLDGLAFGALPEAGMLRHHAAHRASASTARSGPHVSRPSRQTLSARASAPRSLLPRASWSRVTQLAGS